MDIEQLKILVGVLEKASDSASTFLIAFLAKGFLETLFGYILGLVMALLVYTLIKRFMQSMSAIYKVGRLVGIDYWNDYNGGQKIYNLVEELMDRDKIKEKE